MSGAYLEREDPSLTLIDTSGDSCSHGCRGHCIACAALSTRRYSTPSTEPAPRNRHERRAQAARRRGKG